MELENCKTLHFASRAWRGLLLSGLPGRLRSLLPSGSQGSFSSPGLELRPWPVSFGIFCAGFGGSDALTPPVVELLRGEGRLVPLGDYRYQLIVDGVYGEEGVFQGDRAQQAGLFLLGEYYCGNELLVCQPDGGLSYFYSLQGAVGQP